MEGYWLTQGHREESLAKILTLNSSFLDKNLGYKEPKSIL